MATRPQYPLAENRPKPPITARTPAPRLSRVLMLIAVQLAPMAVLGSVYPLVAIPLSTWAVAGVGLDELMIAAAVLSPLLSQTVSGAVFRALESVPRDDAALVAGTTVRELPRALVVGAPFAGAVAFGLGGYLDWSLEATGALLALLMLHQAFAALLVPAFARGSVLLLLAPWLVYAQILVADPYNWWLPPFAATGTLLALLLFRSRGRFGSPRGVGFGRMLASSLRGTTAAVPLWSVPLGVYLLGPEEFPALPIFGALVPALIAYQVYFATVAAPLWRRIDAIRRVMQTHPYGDARLELQRMTFHARAGTARVIGVVLLVGPLSVGFAAANAWPDTLLFGSAVLATCVSVIVIAQSNRLSMLHRSTAPHFTAAGYAAAIAACVLSGADASLTLGVLAIVGVACMAFTAAANRRMWRLPEHQLFWRTALAQ